MRIFDLAFARGPLGSLLFFAKELLLSAWRALTFEPGSDDDDAGSGVC